MINELMRRRAMMATGEILPYDSQVEYLQGAGPQYIETGIIPTTTTGIKVTYTKTITSDLYMCGMRNDVGNTRWCIANNGYYGYGGYSAVVSIPTNVRLEGYLNYLNDKTFKITNYVSPLTLPTLGFVPLYNIRLFGSAGVNGSYNHWQGKIHEAIITENSAVVMHLIPVRVGQVGYMYDKVSGRLFGNGGYDNFILGNDIN